MSQGQPSPFSVLIATRNRWSDLERCLRSLLALDYPEFEVIVLDQSDPLRVLPQFEDPRVRHLPLSLVGKSPALNVGLREAAHEYLAFTDDDCTVEPGWLRRAADVLDHEPDAALLFSRFEPVPHDPVREYVPQFHPDRYRRVRGRWNARDQRHSGGISGGNMVGRRSMLQSLGGFDECLGPGRPLESLEDFDIAYRARRAGFTIVFDPENPVLHHGVRSYEDGSAQALLRGYYYGLGATLAKHLRCGDVGALGDIGLLSLWEAGSVMQRLVKTGRPTGAQRALGLWRGVARGLRQPLDRRTRHFISREG